MGIGADCDHNCGCRIGDDAEECDDAEAETSASLFLSGFVFMVDLLFDLMFCANLRREGAV